MNAKINDFLSRLYAREDKWLTVHATGAGTGLVADIQSVKDSSKTFLGANITYHRKLSHKFLAPYFPNPGNWFVCRKMTQSFAYAGFRNIQNTFYLDEDDVSEQGLASISISGNVDSTEPRPEGRDFQVWISLFDGQQYYSCNIIFPKNDKGMSVLGRDVENALSRFHALKMIFKHFEIGELALDDFSFHQRPTGLSKKEQNSLSIKFFQSHPEVEEVS